LIDSLIKIIFFRLQSQNVLKENEKNVNKNEKKRNIYQNKSPAVFFSFFFAKDPFKSFISQCHNKGACREKSGDRGNFDKYKKTWRE